MDQQQLWNLLNSTISTIYYLDLDLLKGPPTNKKVDCPKCGFTTCTFKPKNTSSQLNFPRPKKHQQITHNTSHIFSKSKLPSGNRSPRFAGQSEEICIYIYVCVCVCVCICICICYMYIYIYIHIFVWCFSELLNLHSVWGFSSQPCQITKAYPQIPLNHH